MIVEVAPRLRDYVPYAFWLLGTPTRGCSTKVAREGLDFDLYVIWSNMLRRCYDPTSIRYDNYGGKGVSVCRRWHTVSAFIEDVVKLEGWSAKAVDWTGYQLDKDYYSSNQYGPDTCVWLHHSANSLYTSKTKQIRGVCPEGVEHIYLSMTEAASAFGKGSNVFARFVGCGTVTASDMQIFGWRFETFIPSVPLRYTLTGETHERT